MLAALAVMASTGGCYYLQAANGQWQVLRKKEPIDDVIEDAATGDALAHETIFAGELVEDDIRAEVSLLRAELDLLKRAFRRHCSEE